MVVGSRMGFHDEVYGSGVAENEACGRGAGEF